MKYLFESNVFNYTFDFDEWPALDVNDEKDLQPYNKSMFKLRYEYCNTFRKQFEDSLDLMMDLDTGKVDKKSLKLSKIAY